ncbi:MAG TPA: TonB-dependent receptor [Pyrinomonadaceae bacterium]|nr:TonB-dependent receptor [Pyrinomonadaceae bacterium]
MRRHNLFTRAAAVLLLAFAPHAFAPPAAHARQQTSDSSNVIVGRVTDARGAGVAGAQVTLYARDRSATTRVSTRTDDAGAYRFERVAPGEYVVEAEAAGFARGASQVVRRQRGDAASATTASVDLMLEVAGVSEEVFVTAQDSPQTVDEVSKAASVVMRREIEERDEFSIAEALRTVPGLRVQQLGGPGAFVSVKARGLRNQDTAVLFDGLRFRDVTAPQGDASGFLSDLVMTGASRVEILRGAGSSLYGTNAVGGVINVVTEEGGGPFRGSLFAEGGGLGFARGRVQLAGGAGNADRIIYSAALSHLNVSRGVDRDDAARNTSAQARLLARLAPTATFTARVYTADSFAQLNENPLPVGALPANGIVEARPVSDEELRRFESGTAVGDLNAGAATFVPAANDPDNARAGRFFSGALTFAQQPRESFGYSLTYHALLTRNSFREGPSGAGDPTDFSNFFEPFGPTRNDLKGRAQTLAARADFRLGRHNSLTAGYEFEHEHFLNRSFGVTSADDSTVEVTERSHTFFIQDQLRFFDERLQMSVSFRAQTFALDRPRFTPETGAPYAGLTFSAPPNAYTGDGSVAYHFRSTGTKLRAHVGNGYRKASLFERFGASFFFGSFSPIGDPRLAPERSVAFDAGVDQTLASGRARLSATYFYTRLQEVVGFGDTPGDPFGRLFGGFLNTGGGLARGAELSATLAPHRTLDLYASYTYANSDQRRPQVAGVIRSFGIAEHQFALVATQRVGRRVLFNFDLAASSDYLAPLFDNRTFASRAYSFKGILKADLGASYTWPLRESRSLRVFGKVENLFDREYYENGFRTPGRFGVAGAAYSF